jgi:hypothetical protein
MKTLNWKKIWNEFEKWNKDNQNLDSEVGHFDSYERFIQDTNPTWEEQQKAIQKIVEEQLDEK